MIYYEVKTTGHIVSECDVKRAYEICTGHTFNGNVSYYRRWANLCPVRRIPENEITVERLIRGDEFVGAVKLYREKNSCSLLEARDACNKIRNGVDHSSN